MSDYRVDAPLVIARQSNGQNLHLYAGAPVPDSVGADERKRLEEGGFISKVGDDEGGKSTPRRPTKS